MNLETQIQSLIVSFVYGLFISLTYNILYKYLYTYGKITKIVLDITYVILITLIYFFILLKINNGNVHPYFIGTLILGFIIGNKKTKTRRTIPKIKIKQEEIKREKK